MFSLLISAALLAAPDITISGNVAEEADKARLLAAVRALYSEAKVNDQLGTGNVSASGNWHAQVLKLITPKLKQIKHGQLSVDGNKLSLQGEVADETQRQAIVNEMATALGPSFLIDNGLRVVASEQSLVDAALADRIIEFDTGKASLTEVGKQILDQMSQVLLKLKEKRIALIGHTDNVGLRSANIALSQARAEAVRDYLIAKGQASSTITVSGEGPDRPVADNSKADGRARNRRIEFKVL